MKKLLGAFLVFLPFIAIIVGVNYYADPANVLQVGYEQKVAQILVDGQNASNLRNMDDRSLMREYAENTTLKIDTLLLGSSHSMQLTKEIIGDENTFCAGVTGSDLRDCISIWSLMLKNGQQPKRVVLTMDPWMLAEGCLDKRAMTDGYVEFCKENGMRPLASEGNWQAQLERVSQAFSLVYFQSSVQYLKQGLQNTKDPVATTDFYTDTDLRRADGSYGYGAQLRNVTEENMYDRVKNYILFKPELMAKFDGISQSLYQQLSLFLDELKQDGREVVLFLSPFNNAYYDHMKTQTDNYVEILSVEPLLQQLAKEKGIKVVGSYDPYACGMTQMDFYDGLHCSSEAIERFWPTDVFETIQTSDS